MYPKQRSGIPKEVEDLIRIFDRFPGIGPKTAARLAFFWLRLPTKEVKKLTQVMIKAKTDIGRCSTCFNLSTGDVCEVCKDADRNHNKICVVEDALDLISIERVGQYDGVYHVLEGVISPVNNVSPEDLTIDPLIARVKAGSKSEDSVEVIIATNPTMEGEATAMYIRDLVKKIDGVMLSRLAQVLPSGAVLEYADQLNISRALEQRNEYK